MFVLSSVTFDGVKPKQKCPLAYQNRNGPFLCFAFVCPCSLFLPLWIFCKKISCPEALRATIRVGLDLEHPGFFRPLAWTGVQPCRACRAERLGRSVGPSQRNELFD